MTGRLFVVAGPSGVGKSTLEKRLLAEFDDLAYSVSATTRPPRPGEKDGRDYFFVDRAEFDRMIETNELLEWAEFYGHRYGTPAGPLQEAMNAGRNLVIDVEVEGVEQLRRRFGNRGAVHILIVPPSMAELERRLSGRGTETEADLKTRLDRARYELTKLARLALADRPEIDLGYDYVIINDDLETAYDELRAVVVATRAGLANRREALEKLVAAKS